MATINESGQRGLWDRNRTGLSRKYETAVDLWNACCDYFKACEASPIIEEKPHAYMGEIVYSQVKKVRPFTIKGLHSYLGIWQKTWEKYRDDHEYEDGAMAEVCAHVEMIIYEQKFSHAATGQMNASLIARELGLADKQEVKSIQVVTDSGDNEW